MSASLQVLTLTLSVYSIVCDTHWRRLHKHFKIPLSGHLSCFTESVSIINLCFQHRLFPALLQKNPIGSFVKGNRAM